jgi:hypothetical protein
MDISWSLRIAGRNALSALLTDFQIVLIIQQLLSLPNLDLIPVILRKVLKMVKS